MTVAAVSAAAPRVVVLTAALALAAGCSPEDATFTPAGPLELVISPPDLRIVKDEAATFTVALAGNRPEADVVVEVAANDSTVTVQDLRLELTPEDFESPRTVRLFAHRGVDYDFQRVSLDVTSDTLAPKSISVLVIEPFLIGTFDVCPGDQLLVWLDGDPLQPVTVTITPSSGGGTAVPSTFSFTSPDVDQVVTVSGPVGAMFEVAIPAIPEVEPAVVSLLSAADPDCLP